MHLAKNHGDYYRIVKSVRDKDKVQTVILKYVGKLTPIEFNQLKIKLQSAQEVELNGIVNKLKNSSHKKQNMQIAPEVSLKRVRANVYKKEIDQKWLRKAYLKDGFPIGTIAQLLGVSKDLVRAHLDEMGIENEKRLELSKSRETNHHIEFGWHIVEGIKMKDPQEYKIIQEMIDWKICGLSYEAIARKLTEMGIKGRLGASKWDRSVIRKIILRNSDFDFKK